MPRLLAQLDGAGNMTDVIAALGALALDPSFAMALQDLAALHLPAWAIPLVGALIAGGSSAARNWRKNREA